MILDLGPLQQGCHCPIELSYITMQTRMNLENGQVFQLFDCFGCSLLLLLPRGKRKSKKKGFCDRLCYLIPFFVVMMMPICIPIFFNVIIYKIRNLEEKFSLLPE